MTVWPGRCGGGLLSEDSSPWIRETFSAPSLRGEREIMEGTLEARDPTREVAALSGFSRALGRETHVLTLYPTLIWQQLFNRLQWEGRCVAGLLEGERERRSGPTATPWIRARTPLGESPTLIRALAGHESLVWDCRVSSCGSFVVSASFDNMLRVWDAETGADLATLRGHSGEVLACGIGPDDSFIVSASTDRTLKIWDVETLAERHTLTGHADEVVGCLISPDGGR